MRCVRLHLHMVPSEPAVGWLEVDYAQLEKLGVQCDISQFSLRDGARYCAKHTAQADQDEQPAPAASYVPDGTVCATCGGSDDLCKDPSDDA